MITKKEDLLKTYITNDNGKLRDLYLELCESFEVQGTPKSLGCSDASGWKCNFIGVYYGGIWIADEVDTESKEAKQLTIEDLIPQTKEVEWENGEPLEFMGEPCVFIGMSEGFPVVKYTSNADNALSGTIDEITAVDMLSKPETEAERVERELDDLFKSVIIDIQQNEEVKSCNVSIDASFAIMAVVKAMLKAGYRKESE